MTEREIARLSSPVLQAYRDMEDELLMLIGRQLGKYGRLTDTARWRVRQLAKAGEINRKAIEIIDSYADGITAEVYEAVIAAAESEVGKLDGAMLNLLSEKGELTDEAAQALGSFERQSRQEMNVANARIANDYAQALAEQCNLVNTVMGYSVRSMYVSAVDTISRAAVHEELNAGGAAVVSGNESLNEAVRRTIHRMAEKGIPGFVDKAGREWTPEAYVRMDLRSTMGNTARAAQDERCDAYGISLIEVSSHMGARPKCAPYQGRIFSRDGSRGTTKDINGNPVPYSPLSETSYGEPDGLFGINCGHQQYPFIPGLSMKSYYPYPEEENAERYREFQAQRGMERKIRADKRDCMMQQAAGNEEGLKEAAKRLKLDKDKYRDYSKAHGLGVHNENTQVYGYDRSKSMKTVWAGKKADDVYYAKGNLNYGRVVGEKPPSKAMKKALNQEYEKFCAEFGEITTISSIDIVAYQGDDVYGTFGKHDSVLTLFGAGGDEGMAFLADTARAMKKSGHWSTGNPMHAFRHELGHAWQKQLEKTDKNYNEKIAKIKQKKNDFWNALTAKPDYGTLNLEAEQKKILSRYGLDQNYEIDELISECVAEYVNGKPRAFASEVIAILRE
jgi:hypothetical protein